MNRNKDWYFDQTVEVSDDMVRNNNSKIEKYGDHYIDMLTPVMENGSVRVFTDDNYYISQDCAHLTRFGAMYYARILDLSFITK